jgi:hypothetical protein
MKGFDCKYMNSPPCECTRPEADAVWASATAADLPPPARSYSRRPASGPETVEFPSYRATSPSDRRRVDGVGVGVGAAEPSSSSSSSSSSTTCGAFALELAGGYGGERGLVQLAEKLVAPSGGSVDVFAHLFAHGALPQKIAEALPHHAPKDLLKVGGSRGVGVGKKGGHHHRGRSADDALAAAFGSRLRDAVFEVWDPEVIGGHVRAVANNRTGALDWLEAELARRYSRIFCGNLGVPNGSPEQKCRRTWPQVLVHTLSMWRKIYLASSLRRRFEETHGCRYELVVRTRPDYVLLQELDLRRFRGMTRAQGATTLADVAALNPQAMSDGGGFRHHTAHTFCGGFMRPHKDTEWCEWRAKNWPDKACFADDQFALGDGEAMEAYARLFPDFDRWAWWYPLNRKDGFRHLSERLLLTHLDWRQRASTRHASLHESNADNEAFRWDSKMPNGSAAHLYFRLDRSQDQRLRGH